MKDIIISVGVKDSPKKMSIVIKGEEYEKAESENLGNILKYVVGQLEIEETPEKTP